MSIIDLSRADQTVVVDAEMSVADLQRELKEHALMLGVLYDPASSMSLSQLFMHRRHNLWQGAYGYLRDQVLAGNWLLADGKNIDTGAKVVKSVAGYDLTRLLIGSGMRFAKCNTLTLRLRPLRQELYYYRITLADYLTYSHYALQPMSAIADGPQHIILASHFKLRRDYLEAVEHEVGERTTLDLLRKFNDAPGLTAMHSRPDSPPHSDFDWNSWHYPSSAINDFALPHFEQLCLALCPNGERFSIE